MQPALDDQTVAAIRRALLGFFDDAARPLPWRATRDPYTIWISEVMSQQTRIETVLPYYSRWLERFPDVHRLAEADVDDVLKHWEGLGYYSRARNLHAAARIVRERHAGVVPATYDALRALPGVGDYTAGAVASIAGGEARAAVDGNVRRVLARLLDLAQPTPPALTRIAGRLVPHDRPGDFNQALMELGATVCTPRAPRCPRCPLSSHCAAFRNGTQLQRPLPKQRKPIPTIDVATVVVVDPADRMLLVRRTAGLLRGLWSFPGAEVAAGEDVPAAARALAQRHGADPTAELRPLGIVEHTFSHRRERYTAFITAVVHPVGATPDRVWTGHDLGRLALPRAQQKIRALALQSRHAG